MGLCIHFVDKVRYFLWNFISIISKYIVTRMQFAYSNWFPWELISNKEILYKESSSFIIFTLVQLTLNTSAEKKHSRKIPMEIPNTEKIARLPRMEAAGFTVGIDVRIPERTKHILQKFSRPRRLIDSTWRMYRRITILYYTIQWTSWWLIRVVIRFERYKRARL